MHPREQTIFSVSSGRPPSAIAIVRVSGPLAGTVLVEIAGKLPVPRMATRVLLRDPGQQPIEPQAVDQRRSRDDGDQKRCRRTGCQGCPRSEPSAGVAYGNFTLKIYSLSDGKSVGNGTKGVLSPERAFVSGKRLYYAQQTGGRGKELNMLKALDLDNGKVVWEVALKPRSNIPLPP